jgi:5-methylcytosine-specific restriction enzyme A
MANEWSDEELRASVVAYNNMLSQQERGEKFLKMDVYRRLGKKFNRTPKAFEYRMQNISAVLADMGRKRVEGLLPAANFLHRRGHRQQA